ncbi:hypothetical protein H0H87_011496 [Tephrocybe sp. NHM501043]|nr:hypothetical protein H0H87_011496 [Tephrocybe sp. NHM501043]
MSTKVGSKPAKSWYSRVASFNVESLFSQKRQPGPPRTIYVNENIPEHHFDRKGKPKPEFVFTSNQVITSKYTIITFLPRNLLEQFRRIANLFFLTISILQFFPKFATISPAVVILPLIIILGITALKDGYEDIKRHESDKRINHSTVKVLAGGEWKNTNIMQGKSKTFVRGLTRPLRRKSNQASADDAHAGYDSDAEYEEGFVDDAEKQKGIRPHWQRVLWEDLKVGDFVKIMDNEPIPADIMICATSEDDDVAFVETKNLDGETNLKSRHGVASLAHLRDAVSCSTSENSFRINCDRPDVDMYRLQANVKVSGDSSPIDLSVTLLRGTVLRNTRWAIGVVMFTGLDTKIVMNSGGTPSKRSKVERQMNPQVIVNLLVLAAMATVCAIADSLLEVKYFPLNAPWLYGATLSDDNPRINGLITWVFSLLTFQTIVPISLYVSIEFVRTCQAAFIYFDGDICYEKTGQATICRSWNLSDDLGQIEYIFSDKTGTLTQNSMVFRQCSVGGRAYRGDEDMEDGVASSEVLPPKPVSTDSVIDIAPMEVSVDLWAAQQSSGSNLTHGKPQHHLSQNQLKSAEKKKAEEPRVRFRDASLTQDLEDSVTADLNSENATHARLLNGFFTVLALCHTVVTSVDPLTGEIQYKSQSPDEAALVQAAADVGFVFCGRDKDILSIRTPSSTPDVEKYELLNILEFTSARKRMSVVLRKLGDDGRLFMLSKGADNIIFQRLKSSEQELMDETEVHLNEFANSGLRTLTLAYKVISDLRHLLQPESDYFDWNKRYHEASLALDDREGKVEAVCSDLEQDLRLLGATAIEDRLQDGVPETIADLKRAGIRIWVATGDKLETAIAIGRSTNLIANDSNIIIIRGGVEGRSVHQQMVYAIDKFFADVPGDLPRPSTSSREANIPLQRIQTNNSIVGAGNGDRPGGFVLVVDGAALLDAFEEENSQALLLRLATMCEGVICCRVSPLQKALIVRLVKDGLGVMTLAIGDGANDVSMIQAADVGVGISGEEGLQAVNSSDYAIGQVGPNARLVWWLD